MYITSLYVKLKNMKLKILKILQQRLIHFVQPVLVKLYCSNDCTYFLFILKHKSIYYLAPPIGKLPKLNDLIGAKAIDGSFYRAKVVKKVNDVSYNVQLIDFGTEENVNLSNIVSLSSEIKKVFILI